MSEFESGPLPATVFLWPEPCRELPLGICANSLLPTYIYSGRRPNVEKKCRELLVSVQKKYLRPAAVHAAASLEFLDLRLTAHRLGSLRLGWSVPRAVAGGFIG